MMFNYNPERTQVLSYGGGVNSVAVIALVAAGKLPRPDFIVIADTGREASATWSYLDEVVQPYLARHDLPLVQIAPHDLSKVDLYGHNGDLLLPMYTTQGESLGKLPTFCSSEWKANVVHRWLRQQGVEKCDMWIGFSTSEVERVKPSARKWARRVFPLIDLMLPRHGCLEVIRRAGLPEPPKSACWMCPHRNNEEWRYLRDEWPDDWRKAVKLEQEVRKDDPHIWLHRDAVPLPQANIDTEDGESHLQCGLGMCFL